MFKEYQLKSFNATISDENGEIRYQTDSHDIQLFTSILEGYNGSTPSYEDLTPSQCTSLYNKFFLSGHRNVFLITKNTSNATYNDTVLDISMVDTRDVQPSRWMCPPSMQRPSGCDTNELASRVASGLPWWVKLTKGEEVEISRCKSEKIAEKCKVQFSLGIMIVVIVCNLVKGCSMIMTVVRSREPTLVTLGDAIDSFLRIPDPTTMDICFADRQLIEGEWMRRRRAGPRQWRQNGAQRWWTSVSKTRWISCNFFCAITIIFAMVLLGFGIRSDQSVFRTDIKSM